jgi:dephospho-CoA kinase
MRIIGLTGGIGAGKGTIAGFLRRRGAALIDTDEIARALLAAGSQWLAHIVKEFGPRILRPDGSLDRSALAHIIFSDAEARARLNALLHPLVIAEVRRRLEKLQAGDSPPAAAVVVAPLLFETRAESLVEKVIVVTAPEEERIRRLQKRDRLSEPEIRARFASQMSPEEMKTRADWVIDNRGDLAAAEKQVETLWGELTSSR